jgi:hypothetical protein
MSEAATNAMKGKPIVRLVLLAGAALCLLGMARAATDSSIDPVDKWAWSTNAGWISFSPACGDCEGVTVYSDHLEGYAWGENIGWIHFKNAVPAYNVVGPVFRYLIYLPLVVQSAP